MVSIREFSFPFALARGVMEKVSPNRAVLAKGPSYIEYLAFGPDVSTQTIYIDDDHRKSTLTIRGLVPSSYRLPPGWERMFARIEKCMRPVLDHHFGITGTLLGISYGTAVEAAYEISFPYDDLDDEECCAFFNNALACCGMAARLARPILTHSEYCRRRLGTRTCNRAIRSSALSIFSTDLTDASPTAN